MARTKLNDGQLEKLVNADKVSGASLNITGSDVSALTSLTGGDHFLVQSGSAVPKKITADTMQDFFSKTDIKETGDSASYQLVFADDDNEYNAANASSYSSFQTSRLQESSVTSATTSLTFSPEYGASAAAGLAVIFTDSSSNKVAFVFDSSVSSGATSVAVSYNAGLSNATSMNKSSISSVTSVSKGTGDGSLRVDGSHLNYNPSTNKMTLAGNLQAARLEIDGTSDYIDVSTDLQLIAAADILLDPAGSDVKVDGNVIPNADDGGTLGSADNNWSDLFIADGGILNFGDDQEVKLTHVADTGLLLNGAMQLQFSDASQYINAPSATVLDINATDEVELNATLVDVNANLDVSGTYTGAGLMTTGGSIVIPDAANIGSASDTDAIAISSGGVVTFSQRDVHSGGITVADGGQIGSASDLDAMAISSGGVVTFSQRDVHSGGITVADGGQIGSASDLDAMAISSGGVVTFSQRDVHSGGITVADAGQIGSASDPDAIAISSGGDVTFTQDLLMANGKTIGSAGTADLLTVNSANLQIKGSSGSLLVDTISESTSAAGVTIDGVKMKDNDIIVPDGSTIGSTSAPAAMTVASTGIVTFVDDILLKDAATIGNASVADVMTLAASGIVTFKDDIIVKDGGTIGSATTAGAITIASNGKVTLSGDLEVGGTTTTVSTANLLVEDKLVTLNDGGSASSGGGSGIEIEEDGSATGFFKVASDRAGWELQAPGNSNTLTIDATASSVLLDVGANVTIDGTLNVESASVINQDLSSDSTAAQFATLTIATSLIPDASGGADLGSTSAEWGDLYIGDDKKVQFGAEQDFTIEYDEDGDNVAQFAGSNMRLGHGAATQLQFRDDAIYINSDADGYLNARADTGITLAIGSSDIAQVTSAGLLPGSADGATLGGSSTRWSDLYMADGAVLSMGASSYDAKITHSSADRYGDDAKDDRLTASFSAFQTSRIQESTLSSSGTSSITMSPEVGTSIASGTVIVFTAGSDTIAFTVSSSVSSGDSSISVSYNSAASSATSVSVSGISNASKDFGAFKSAFTESTISASVTSLNFSSADAASAFNSKVGSNGTVKIADGSVIATTALSSYSSGTSIGVTISMSGGSSFSASGIDSMTVKQTAPAHSLTVDGSYASLDLADHDGSEAGLKLAGTLVSATAAELNIMDGDTTAASVTLVAGDGVVLNDGGTMKQALVSDFGTFMAGTGVQVSSGVMSIECITDIATSVTKGSVLSSDLKTGSLSQNMVSGSLQVFLNGMLQTQSGSVEGTPDGGSQGAVYDYHLLTSVGPPKVRFEEALDGDDVLQLRYIKA